MYEISRVRLHSVGPKGARYQDVVLDLSDVGAPVARPSQAALFDLTDRGGPVLRPSPASVLFAENGNGKSVLIKLLFSVMLPGKKQVVGTTNTRVLENFVLATDVAHVAIEWQHTVTGDKVVTGKVAAWRGHVVSTDPTRLSEAWYSFRPGTGLTLDTLPVAQDGRLVEMTAFRERLSEASRDEPSLQVVWEQGHGAWTEHLNNLGLDSELFAYQRKMNAGEGEAADAFAFKNDEAFVDWLLTAVTDPEDPRSLADVLDGYASMLAQRDTLIAERDFVAGALEKLGPLAAAASDATSATEADRRARLAAERFTAAVLARHDHEQARLQALTDLETAATERERAADQNQRRLNRIVLELGRTLARLRMEAAETARDALRAEHQQAKDHAAAWAATDTLLVHAAATEKATALRVAVGTAESKAAPALTARDHAAARLLRALAAIAEDADTRAAADDAAATQAHADRQAEDGRAREHGRRAERCDADARNLLDRITEAQAAVAAAIAERVLAEGESPTTALDRATEQATTASERVRDADAEQARLAAARTAALQAQRSADRQVAAAARAADRARDAHTAAERATAALTAEERLAALLGTEQVLLDKDAAALLAALDHAIEDAEAEQTRLRVADDADQHVLDALGSGGLLPPPTEVTEVKATLETAGIPSYAGWEYLAQMPEEEREQALAAYPHLVDGVVLNNADHLDRAQEVLRAARLLPRKVVAVGATATLQTLDGTSAPGTGFLVDPNPALYDDERAEAERQSLVAAQTDRHTRQTEVATQVRADRALHARLAAWQDTYGDGALAALQAARDGAEATLAEAEQTAEQAAEQVAEAIAAEQALTEALPAWREAAAAAQVAVQRLTGLAGQVAAVPAWTQTVTTLREEAAAAERDAVAAQARAETLTARAQGLTRRADDQRRAAAQARADMAEVHGALDPALAVPAEDVPTLKVAYREAVEAYAKVQVRADLRADLDRAEAAEAATRAEADQIPAPVRAAAQDLLGTPDGADAPARAAASARAARQVEDLAERINRAGEDLGELRSEYQRFQPQEVSLEPYGRPASIAEAQALRDRANTDYQAAQGTHEQLRVAAEAASAQRAATEQELAGFATVCEVMQSFRPEYRDEDQEPFAGDPAAARARMEVVRADVDRARTDREETQAVLRRAASGLSRYAAEERFDAIESLVQRQIRAVDVDDLAQYAAEWDEALKPRLRTLTDDLAQIDRHRTQIVARLRGLVEVALKTLRSAERVSELPSTLGDWGGQKFLRIRFTDPDPATLDDRLAEVVDDAAHSGARGEKAGGKRDGITLLLKGVRAVLPRGVKVEMLKPDASLRTERVRVAAIADVFSGGQLLTAAIILYCTMAALRSNDRGLTGRRHAGVLFLDNPIGRASAGYLLDLQLGVADALGVQLVYTTGLFDTNALSVFPLIVRLRNDQDLRTGMKYLTVEEEIRRVLAALPAADGTGVISTARVFRKRAEAAS